jgi:PhnB protein
MKAVERKEKTAGTEAEIRALAEQWADAVRSKDIEGVISYYSPDVRVFGITTPLQYTGADAHRQHWQQMFESFDGPVGCEFRDFELTTAGDVAFATCFNQISGKMKNGQEGGSWVRATVGYERTDGKWLVTHEHVSVPFHMDGSFRAAIDLKP